MFGSNVTIRLAAGVPHIYTRSFALARPIKLLPTVAFTSQRSYATPGRPKKAVGEPTKTVKRAVKRTAAEKKPEATKPKTPAEKPVKEPTEKQKAGAKAKVDKAKLQELKDLALPTPKGLVSAPKMSAWTVYNSNAIKEKLAGTTGTADLGPIVKELSRDYKQLSPAEREHYNHIANESNKQKSKEYSTWVESYTTEQIYKANIARRKLRTQSTQNLKKYRHITDKRVEKKPPGPYAIFLGERYLSGDFKGVGGGSAATLLIGAEWKALTDGEKQKYVESAAKLKEEYTARQAAL